MEQKILTWSRNSIDYIGTQLATYLNSQCIDGWYVHQMLPITTSEYQGGNLRLESCMIILHRHKK